MHNNKDLFIAALQYTSRKTGFSAYLIEKDYYCSICLMGIFQQENMLLFKGGTLLNKVYCGFYRLSEDLDFSVPVQINVSRSERKKLISPLKSLFKKFVKNSAVFSLSKELTGFNESKQYMGELQYQSVITNRTETIKLDIGLREELLDGTSTGLAKTILINPLQYNEVIKPFKVPCLTLEETFAEKIRAALTRKPAAIRDFFDLSFAVLELSIDFTKPSYLALVKEKLKIVDVDIDLSEDRKTELKRQLSTELQPVLREEDYKNFNFDKSFDLLKQIAEKL